MKLTDKDKEYILNQFLKNISHISNEEYQKRVWIRGEGPEYDDFDETVCHFFDDGDPILEKYKDYGITQNQYDLLMKFHKSFDEFAENNYHPKEFISNPEWKKIMKLAKEVLEAFNYEKKPA